AVKIADKLGYPVLMRPSYVLGGQNMIIAHSEADIREYMEIITRTKLENPVLIDKYMMGTEVEVDAICDGTDCLIPGIMEHVERAGVHSGDSISVYPSLTLTEKSRQTILSYTKKLAMALNVRGLVNIQYVVHGGEVYVIEVNPRSSRTVPYISKVTGVSMVDVATKIMLGITLKEQGYEDGLYKKAKYIAVKVPVFSFGKLHDVDTELGPEMKSTGECLGIATDYADAVFKGLVGAGYEFTKVGDSVLITVRDTDKKEVVYVAEKFERMGYKIYATSGTASYLNKNFVAANTVKRISEGHPNVMDLLDSGRIDYVVSTSAKGRSPALDSVKIRRKTVERSICCMTSMDTANAVCDILLMGKQIDDIEMVDITKI
ncbi:MAG: ATP-grasp domain-containing protein, partial [Ruminococcus sp.]|nr:ATP-grasp domain-containing protein [Ruminococcus sp.]